jgi:hypothetical protein
MRTSGKGGARAAARGTERGGRRKKGDDAWWLLCARTEGGKGGEGARARRTAKREGRGPVRRAQARGVWRPARHDRRRREACGATREQGRRESSTWAVLGERGPAGEEGKWAGPRQNSTLLDLFEYFKKT